MQTRGTHRVEPTVHVPWESGEPAARLAFSLPVAPESVYDARTAVGEIVSRWTDDDRVVADVRLCVSEAVTNVVRHAYAPSEERAEQSVDIGVDRLGNELLIVVRDSGRGMTRVEPRETPGGYGLDIIDRLTARLTVVTARDTGTEVAMIFALGASAPRGRTHL